MFHSTRNGFSNDFVSNAVDDAKRCLKIPTVVLKKKRPCQLAKMARLCAKVQGDIKFLLSSPSLERHEYDALSCFLYEVKVRTAFINDRLIYILFLEKNFGAKFSKEGLVCDGYLM
tara:strand:- start:826 stop:1173 length:348 start_codon:yes stop_codon:yes gene_type:complete